MRRKLLFISSVQKEFAKEREELADYIRSDVLLCKFFEPFIFEEIPAYSQSPNQIYLNEVKRCDIYLGLFGNEYGYEDENGVSPTEHEYDLAAELQKVRLIFIKKIDKLVRHPKETAFISKVEKDITWKSFRDMESLRAAVLLFGKKPQKYFISSQVKCMQFYGTEVEKPVPTYQIYKGDVFELVMQATSFVMSRINNWTGLRNSLETGAVETRPELPLHAVQEAIVNAICHRDYTSNASVQVMLFRNRLEIWNPGNLPFGMSIQKLSEPHKSIPTNPLLATPMFWSGYIEQAGTGTEDIIKRCLNLDLKKPEFFQDEDFHTILWRQEPIEDEYEAKPNSNEGTENKPESEQDINWDWTESDISDSNNGLNPTVNLIEEENPTVNSLDNQIIEILKNNPKATYKMIANITQKNRDTISLHLKKLVESKTIERVGSDKTGHWEILTGGDE